MAIKIRFDKSHNAIEPTLVLATRNGTRIGKLPAYNIAVKSTLVNGAEITCSVNKSECADESFWEQLVDFKLLWAREWNKWFEIYVETEEDSDIVKHISAVSLGEAELSQINLYGIEINTDTDISRDDYKPTVLYDASDPEASLLTRISEKIPHYTIHHVDASIAHIQRTFTFDGTSIYDAFSTIAEEINCLFIVNCYSDENDEIVREINVYDLESNCLDCGHRGEYTDVCPECGSTNITMGYGEDTTIFVSTDNLADNITYTTDTGSVKNCFKLEAGDDLMTATIINSNPNGTAYIWYISGEVKADMDDELVAKLEQYDKDYAYYQNSHPSDISGRLLNAYNDLIDKYSIYTSRYGKITSPLIGYSSLMEAYYNVIDFDLYLSHSLMPDVELEKTTAEKEAAKLTPANLSPVAVKNLASCSQATADSSVLSMAKTLIRSNYQIKVEESSFSGTIWTGTFTVTNYADDEDTAKSNRISIHINDDYEAYVKQKINKVLRQSIQDDDITDVVRLFEMNEGNFTEQLKKYSLSRLTGFHDNCQSCLDVLVEQGLGNDDAWAGTSEDYYNKLYLPYYNKLGRIEDEMKVREDEIAIIEGRYDRNGGLLSDGLQTLIEAEQEKTHKILDFEEYLGEKLWLDFAAYRREDTYSNNNYISDGLDNAELFANAREFINVAQKEIYKSATLQHSISATLKNLLAMKEFAPIVDYFEVGNWLRIRVNDKIYRLRLLEYELEYDNLSNISIVFSDVTAIADGTTDINSVLDQASSMASSYDSTRRQAKRGSNSKDWLDSWVERGLDATRVKIFDNADNQNQTWDSHGMLFRQYDPVTDSFDDEQLKILNSTIAVTDDNWKTIKTAIGGFYYIDPVDGKQKYGYGVNGELIIGKLILGESLGLYNSSNSMTFDKNGLKITDGRNTFSVDPSGQGLLSLSDNLGNQYLYLDENGKFHISVDEFELTTGETIRDVADTAASEALKSFIEDTYNPDIKELIDGKIETWYQSADPSASWSEDEKVIHEGDIWFNTTDETYNMWNGSRWEETRSKPPEALIDKWDGKAQVFITKPTDDANGMYYANDLWIVSEADVASYASNLAQLGVTKGDVLTATADRGESFSWSHWRKLVKYTDDVAITEYVNNELANIQKQVDGKIETWYQSADPSTEWSTATEKEAHASDLWYDTNEKVSKKWDGVKWEIYEGALPQELFDKVDGRAQSFIEQPTPPYHLGDLWFGRASASYSYHGSQWNELTGNVPTQLAATTRQYNRVHFYDSSRFSYPTESYGGEYWYDVGESKTYINTIPESQHDTSYVESHWSVFDDSSEVNVFLRSYYTTYISTTPVDEIEVWESNDEPRTTGYYAIWIRPGTDIMVCVNERLTGEFNINDWQKRDDYATSESMSRFYSEFIVEKNRIHSEVVDLETNTQSQIDQFADSISAKVDSVSEDSGFGWELLSDGWRVYYGDGRRETDVLTVDKYGLYLRGEIEADSGYIGDWEIGSRAIYNGTDSPYVDEYTQRGTYIGTDGFLNYSRDNEYVQIKDGTLTAYGATIYGEVNAESGTIGGWSIGENLIYTTGSFWDDDIEVKLNVPSGSEGESSRVLTITRGGTVRAYIDTSGYAQFYILDVDAMINNQRGAVYTSFVRTNNMRYGGGVDVDGVGGSIGRPELPFHDIYVDNVHATNIYADNLPTGGGSVETGSVTVYANDYEYVYFDTSPTYVIIDDAITHNGSLTGYGGFGARLIVNGGRKGYMWLQDDHNSAYGELSDNILTIAYDNSSKDDKILVHYIAFFN